MTWEEKVAAFLEDPERRTKAFRYAWYLSLAFLLFGYGYIAYTLFW